MNLCNSSDYMADVAAAAAAELPWEQLDGKRVAITGATGLIGRFLTDVLAYRNRNFGGRCSVLALSRGEDKARACFFDYWGDEWFSYASHDVTLPVPVDFPKSDYILHCASNTHPRAYATDPVGTIAANVFGTSYLLDYAVRSKALRFLFLSSVEIYGESLTDNQVFSETELGYIDCNTLRAGYPEGKRTGEALCQAYRAQHGLSAVIARLPRVYGPTVLPTDSKASSQFLRSALDGRDITLKSKGNQFYSYLYVADAVTAILTVLLKGEDGMAYNAADAASDITLRELAGLCADWAGKSVVFDLPDSVEQAGYSKATRAILNSDRLKAIGWRAETDMASGVNKTLNILNQITK